MQLTPSEAAGKVRVHGPPDVDTYAGAARVTTAPPDPSRTRTGNRGLGEMATPKPPTRPTPRSQTAIAADMSALGELMAVHRAEVAADLAAAETRLALRWETERLTQLSSQLTAAQTSARRWKVFGSLVGSTLAGLAIMATTCFAAWRDARSAVADPAADAKPKGSIAGEVAEHGERLERIERNLERIADHIENDRRRP